LLLKAGVPLATVQRILRHTDPRLTAMTYGHLDVGDMRSGLNNLAVSAIGNLPVAARALAAANAPHKGAGECEVVEPDFRRDRRASVGCEDPETKKEAADPTGNSGEISGLEWSGRQDSKAKG
jgi:hypothetical protein